MSAIRILSLALLVVVIQFDVAAQSFNEDKTSFTNFLKRMYSASPFEGVKVVEDYDSEYLVSVISLDNSKYPSSSVMSRVAEVKAQSQVSTFLNGAYVDMDLVISRKEKVENDTTTNVVETMETIRQNSSGFSQGLELLTNFNAEGTNSQIFIYYSIIK